MARDVAPIIGLIQYILNALCSGSNVMATMALGMCQSRPFVGLQVSSRLNLHDKGWNGKDKSDTQVEEEQLEFCFLDDPTPI